VIATAEIASSDDGAVPRCYYRLSYRGSASCAIAFAAKPIAFLYVSDADRALAFYRDVLGLSLHGSDQYGVFLESAATLVRMTVLPDFAPTPHPVLGWNVADIASAAADLQGNGVVLTVFDGMGQDEAGIWTSDDGGKLAWFADPDGNVLMLAQD